MVIKERVSKKKLIVGIFVLFLLIFGIGTAFFLIDVEEEDELVWRYYDVEPTIESFCFGEVSNENPSDVAYVICDVDGFRSRNTYVPHHYMVQLSSAGRSTHWLEDGRSISRREHERYILRAYDFSTREFVREFDLLEILEDERMTESHGIIANAIFDLDFVELDGQMYMQKTFLELLENGSLLFDDVSNAKRLLINISTGEYRILSFEEARVFRERRSRELDIQLAFFDSRWDSPLGGGEINLFLERNGIINDGDEEYFWINSTALPSDVFRITLSSNNLPMENERLYNMFPGLVQFREQYSRIDIILTGSHWTAEEILRLFMEDGQEISFEGATMSSISTIDGEEHEIHSFEDYLRLLDTSDWD